MDSVLKAIHYNPECFSKIVEDFDDYVELTTPGVFQKGFDDIKKSAVIPEENLICVKITTKNMEHALAELKDDPGCYLEDFDEIKEIVEGEPTEEKIEEWLDDLPCHLYIFLQHCYLHSMEDKLAKTYYSPGGYWKRITAIKNLAEAAKVPEETAKK